MNIHKLMLNCFLVGTLVYLIFFIFTYVTTTMLIQDWFYLLAIEFIAQILWEINSKQIKKLLRK